MYGWRARLGRINPSPETVGDEEWRRLCPDGVAVVSTRMYIERVDQPGLDAMVRDVHRATRELVSARCNVCLMAGTAGAFNGGPGFDRELIKRMQQAGALRSTTTMTSVLDALRAVAVRKVAVATPYIKAMDEALRATLEAAGLEVLLIEGMGILKSIDMGDLKPEQTYEFAREVFSKAPKADGYLISCGNLRTLEALPQLEADFNKPVVTSNQAGLWKVLQICHIDTREIEGGGRLLSCKDASSW